MVFRSASHIVRSFAASGLDSSFVTFDQSHDKDLAVSDVHCDASRDTPTIALRTVVVVNRFHEDKELPQVHDLAMAV